MYNSAINLSVTNNPDGGFTLSGVLPAGYSFSITSGNVTMQGGAVIRNGQLLIGNQTGNSFDQGNLTAGKGISILSGAGNIVISSINPIVQNIPFATGITPSVTGVDNIYNIGQLTNNLYLFDPIGNISDGSKLLFRFSVDGTPRYISYGTGYSFGTDVTLDLIPTTGKFRILFEKVESEGKWEASAIRRGF